MTVSDLAVLGGPRQFVDHLHVGRPNIGDAEALEARIRGMLARKWLSNDGPLLEEFEGRVVDHLGVRNCVAVCNATAGLQILVRALGLSGEVIVPSFTFVATAHALTWLGLTPVFADIDPSTHCISPAAVEALVGPATTGIIGVHLWGRACDTTALEKIASRHRLALIFDAAHAFGCSHDGRMIGSFGTAEVLSFHATKFVNAFEGGAIVTNDDELADRCRRMRSFGFASTDRVVSLGTNAKMHEASAAMGLTSLDAMGRFLEANRNNFETYKDRLARLPGMKLAEPAPGERWNHQYVTVEVDESLAGVSRDLLLAALRAEGILARRYFYPGCHRLDPYVTLSRGGRPLPVTQAVADRVMQFPTGTSIGDTETSLILAIVAQVVARATEIRSKVSSSRLAELLQ